MKKNINTNNDEKTNAKSRISKKTFLTIILLLLALVIFLLVQIFAKYVTSASGQTTMHVARWNIKVNNQEINSNSDISAVIQPVINSDPNIAANVIAPTSTGYFDLNIGYDKVDVSFEYRIEVSPNTNSSVNDLIVTGYEIVGQDNSYANMPLNSQIITGNVAYSNATDRTTNKNLRVHIKWNDDSANGATMNNYDDTVSSLDYYATNLTEEQQKTNKPLLDIKITFTQTASSTNTTNSTSDTEDTNTSETE